MQRERMQSTQADMLTWGPGGWGGERTALKISCCRSFGCQTTWRTGTAAVSVRRPRGHERAEDVWGQETETGGESAMAHHLGADRLQQCQQRPPARVRVSDCSGSPLPGRGFGLHGHMILARPIFGDRCHAVGRAAAASPVRCGPLSVRTELCFTAWRHGGQPASCVGRSVAEARQQVCTCAEAVEGQGKAQGNRLSAAQKPQAQPDLRR